MDEGIPLLAKDLLIDLAIFMRTFHWLNKVGEKFEEKIDIGRR